MFGRGKEAKGGPGGTPHVYAGLREQVLNVEPAAVGLQPLAELPRVYGGLLETGYPNGTATLVALADGTTSLYTTSGFGIIGGGAHQRVADANRRFLRALEQVLDDLFAEEVAPLPVEGESIIRALAFTGRRAARAAENDFGSGHHRLSGVFYAAQDVITQLRLIHQARSSGGG